MRKLKTALGDFIEPRHIIPGSERRIISISKLDELRKSIKGNIKVRDFLASRKLISQDDETAIHFFNLGYHDKSNSIAIPYFMDNTLAGIKYRKLDSKTFAKEKGYESTTYNIDCVDILKPVIVVEGEFDCMAAWLMGFKNVISLPDGASSTNIIVRDLHNAREILIATDMDKDGDTAAKSITDGLGAYRCARVNLPHKDWNECLIQGVSSTKMAELLAAAKPLGGHTVECFSQIKQLAIDRIKATPIKAIDTGWESFDTLMGGGIREKEMTILTAETGVGKTSWALNLLYRITGRVGTLIISGEEDNVEIFGRLASIYAKKPWATYHDEYARSKTKLRMTDSDIQDAEKFYSMKSTMFWCGDETIPINQITELIKFCHMRYDTRFILIDHLHHFINSDNPEHERHSIEKFLKVMNALVKALPIHVLLICHPNKEVGDKVKRVYMNQLKGSSFIKAYAWNIISLARDMESENTAVELWLQKKRYSMARKGFCYFVVDENIAAYEQGTREDYYDDRQNE